MAGFTFKAGQKAIVTGAALGIGRAACVRFAEMGMNVCLVDLAGDDLNAAAEDVRAAAQRPDAVTAMTADVSDADALQRISDAIRHEYGKTDVLINNAVTRVGRGMWADMDEWRRAIDVNLLGVINGVRAFVPGMMDRDEPACVINVGSKQGITNPPGHPVYNLCKAAVKNFTEGLAHEFRSSEGSNVSAHLLVPGWTTTGNAEHKEGAWLPAQVVDFMIERVTRGDFYIICPDGEVTEEMDRKRILWSAADITENRPALSRWEGSYGDAFDAFDPETVS